MEDDTGCLPGNAAENAGVLQSAAMEDKTHYDILGVQPTASHRQIRKAFMKLAEEYQNDRRKFPAAGWYFDRLKAAYDALSDDESRLRYNVERGLPALPPEESDQEGFFSGVDSAVPEWPVILPLIFFAVLSVLAATVWRDAGAPALPFPAP